ncbi:MAG: hypothetical protein COA69_13230 [Robiginitomaculum sp.]|nr:MAG: hypothetical protein COA69_13230 [Robiginitomaculum sp.]
MYPWRPVTGGVILHISLTPKSSMDAVGEIVEGAGGYVLKVKVRAIPDKGAANQAVVKLLGKWVGVPKSSLELVSGGRSRLKSIKISGNSADIVKVLEMRVELDKSR